MQETKAYSQSHEQQHGEARRGLPPPGCRVGLRAKREDVEAIVVAALDFRSSADERSESAFASNVASLVL